jgi:hypothetical protein
MTWHRVVRAASITVCIAVVAGLVALALAGLIQVAGPAASPVLGSVILCAATVWWFRSRRAASRWAPLGKAATQHLESQPTVELCLYWQASHRRLLERIGPLERAGIAEVRRGLLVEFERRDPAGFARFIDDPDSAAGNPRRFFRASDSPEIPPQPDR